MEKMTKITPHNFILSLKHKNIIKRKLLSFIYNIILYANDCEVYKVVVQYHYQTLKKAMKNGALGEYEVVNTPKITLDVDKKYQKGRIILMYNQLSQDISVFEGEDVQK